MDSFFRRREFSNLLHSLDNSDSRGILVLGPSGMGKTVLLKQLEAELQRQGRGVLHVYLRAIGVDDLSVRITSEGTQLVDAFEADRTVRASGSGLLRQGAEVLNKVGEHLRSPVLVLDGLDESHVPQQMAGAVEELSHALSGWRIVVAARPRSSLEVRRFLNHFEVLTLGPLPESDMAALLRQSAPDFPEGAFSAVLQMAKGNPLFASLYAGAVVQAAASGTEFQEHLEAIAARFEAGAAPDDHIESEVDKALTAASDPTLSDQLLEELTLAGGRDRISALAGKLRVPEDHVQTGLAPLAALGLLDVDQQAGTVEFIHDMVREVVLSRRVFSRSFRLDDLTFGAEEAERDDLLDASFVDRHSVDRILMQQRSIVIGDRGSGKSAIFHKLSGERERSVVTRPIANAGDLLRRIVDKDAWLDTDALHAAWLAVIAAVVTSTLPGEAPKQLRRNAANLRAALELPTDPPDRTRSVTRAVAHLLGGTTLNFGVGPVNFQATLPAGTRPGPSFLDVETLLQETDSLLKQAEQRVVVLIDRIDETSKYDRNRQEALVQALLQAEARISRLESVQLVVFLRTDLFELYDIQEKNKLVSRSLPLDWSAENWLQVLIRRVFANDPLDRLASRLRVADEDIELRAALEVLFPAEIENQPVDRWLIDSLRNGNGDISPRLAVLLLQLAQALSSQPDAVVTAVPLFSADAVRRAMTKVSDLSFSEVVNDFKVAPTFVLNCRASKRTSFTLSDVEQLFDDAEGKISDQVRLLERLGFLERVVEQRGTHVTSKFQIPRLYSRCFDYA